MRLLLFPVISLSLLLLVTAPATAQVEERVIVSPTVGFLRAFADNPPPMVQKGIVSTDGFLGSARFSHELSQEEVCALEDLGVVFSLRNGRIQHVGSIYPAWFRWAGLEKLLEFKGLVQLDTDFIFRPRPALETTRKLTGSPELSNEIGLLLNQKPGAGVKIMDLDDGIDPFHPAFFHADGGYFKWIDVDDDGLLTFGVDACDLNENGEAEPEETLQYIDAGFVEILTRDWWKEYEPGDGQFDVGVDWIFADTNANGVRDYGPKFEYYDATPGFGEPILLVDDVNRNGVADLNEKLVLLGHSKIGRVLAFGEEYINGKNLAELDPTVFTDYSAMPGGFHGTGVSGIMVAGTPGLSRHVGMAPYSELYVAEYSSDSMGDQPGLDSTIGKLDWAREQGIDIIVMPIGMSGVTFMDGTTNFELAMDELYATEGILQVVAAGNEGAAGKHMQTLLEPGESTVALNVPEEFPDYPDYPYDTPVFYLSFYWFGDKNDVELSLAAPGMETPVLLKKTGWQGIELGDTGLGASCHSEKSFSGGMFGFCAVFHYEYQGVAKGNYQWTLNNKTEEPLEVHGFVSDYYTSSRTLLFEKWETSDSTIAMPATANCAISVGAFAGVESEPEGIGKLRNYSSRGPRIDGVLTMEIAGPDDPMVPLSTIGDPYDEPEEGETPVPYLFGSYLPFGGTSGASPHVAGSLALLKQYEPDATAQQLYNKLVQGAWTEPFMGTLPNKEWGYGKVNVYKAAFGKMPPGNAPPTAVATLAGRKGLVVVLDSSESSDPEKTTLEFKWDFDYDGLYNMPWMEETSLEYTFEEEGEVTVKLAVRDKAGAVVETLLTFDVADDWVPPEPPVFEPEPDVVETDHIPADTDSTFVFVENPEYVAEPAPRAGSDCGCSVEAQRSGPIGPVLLLLVPAFLFLCYARNRRSTS